MEIGVFTFADVSPHPGGVHAAQRLPELVEEIELADEVGLDVFGIDEHHRPDYAAPAPPILLAAAASRTSRIRLTSAVTVLGTDPRWTEASLTRRRAALPCSRRQRS